MLNMYVVNTNRHLDRQVHGISGLQAIQQQENDMLKILSTLFGNVSKRQDDYRIWAKTEYGKDWQFAYEYLMAYDQAPMLANHSAIRGVTK
jgi:hypothetical protein|tara:strand:- start:245 stop:517 length:273 start_codon:yes stop_codon:yes gene_type:complete